MPFTSLTISALYFNFSNNILVGEATGFVYHLTRLKFFMKNWDTGDGWAGLADQLTLSQPEGADCAPILLLTHPALGSFLRPCLRSIFISYHENLKDKNINLKKTNT